MSEGYHTEANDGCMTILDYQGLDQNCH